MYTIPIKDSSKEIDIAVIQSLLGLAGITAFFYRTNNNILINIILSFVLLAAAFAVRYLVTVLQTKKIILLSVAALLLFAATYAVTFSFLLVMLGMLTSFIYKKPVVLLDEDAVVVKSSMGNSSYDWDLFENIVLKDNLLTLDFKNNKLLHLETDFITDSINENIFNSFCKERLLKNMR